QFSSSCLLFCSRGEITDAVKTFRLPDSHSDRPEMCLSLDPSVDGKYFMRGFSSPMRVTQEGPDVLSPYCPVRVIVRRNDDKFQKGLGYGED
ncbi:hypothetical protein ACWAUA_004833, partial [Enterobacter roggenkampii]